MNEGGSWNRNSSPALGKSAEPLYQTIPTAFCKVYGHPAGGCLLIAPANLSDNLSFPTALE